MSHTHWLFKSHRSDNRPKISLSLAFFNFPIAVTDLNRTEREISSAKICPYFIGGTMTHWQSNCGAKFILLEKMTFRPQEESNDIMVKSYSNDLHHCIVEDHPDSI